EDDELARARPVLAAQRTEVAQAEAGGELVVDAARGVVPGRVWAVDGDAGGGQGQDDALGGGGGGQPVDAAEQDGVSADDEAHAVLDGLGGALRRDGQAGQDALDGRLPLAQQQTDVVPVGGQARRGDLVQEGGDVGDGRHGIPPGQGRGERLHGAGRC